MNFYIFGIVGKVSETIYFEINSNPDLKKNEDEKSHFLYIVSVVIFFTRLSKRPLFFLKTGQSRIVDRTHFL